MVRLYKRLSHQITVTGTFIIKIYQNKLFFPWLIVSFNMTNTSTTGQMAPIDNFSFLSWRKTLVWWVDHLWKLQARKYPFGTTINIFYSPLFPWFLIETWYFLYTMLIFWLAGKFSPSLKIFSYTTTRYPANPNQCASIYNESENHMLDIGWNTSQKPWSKGMEIEVPVVHLGQTSKNADKHILPDVADTNQPVPRSSGGSDNWKFALNDVGFGLISGQMCDEEFTNIAPMVMHTLEFGGDYALRYHKNNLVNECPLTGLHNIFLCSQSTPRPVHSVCYIMHRKFCDKSCRKNKIFLAGITRHAHAHSQ